MSRSVARGLGVLVASVATTTAVAGCSDDGGTTPGWTDPTDAEWVAVVDPTIVAEGDDWQLQVGEDPRSVRLTCLQLVVADTPLGCVTIDSPPGDFSGYHAQARAGGERVVWRAGTIDTDRPIDRYVVWSSASPSGRTVEAIEYADVQNLVWVMEPGEEPWGYQVLADDGSLIEQRTLVGLPGA